MIALLFPTQGEEASRGGAFAGNRIARFSEQRGDDAVSLALADPASRLIVLAPGRAYLDLGGPAAGLWRTIEGASALCPRLDEAVLLGVLDGRPALTAYAGIEAEAAPEGVKAIDLRSIYAQGLLDASDLGALGHAASLLAWHAGNRFCGRCGGPTSMRGGGAKRHCAACAVEHFPRTDPVAIMLAVRQDACLLGRGRHFPPGMYSCLAGFVEPGETLEDAVRRETYEESGVAIGRVAYRASQPWPFPHSLMLGCFAEALSQDIRRDEAELEACRWFDREDVAAMLARAHPDGLFCPPDGAIAARLIRDWAEAG